MNTVPLLKTLKIFQKPIDKRIFIVYNIQGILRQQVPVKAKALLPRKDNLSII